VGKCEVGNRKVGQGSLKEDCKSRSARKLENFSSGESLNWIVCVIPKLANLQIDYLSLSAMLFQSQNLKIICLGPQTCLGMSP
jgi:hypothetical protein